MAVGRARKKTMTDAELAAYTLFDIKRRALDKQKEAAVRLRGVHVKTKKRKKKTTGYG